MRIQGPTGAATFAAPNAPRRAGDGSFAPKEAADSRAPASTTALRTVGGIDALIALQGVEDPLERRRHAVRRGRRALDVLDELKLGLLDGTLSPATLNKLHAAAGFAGDASGDPGLDAVLEEIELRVAVEIAKTTSR